MSHDQKTVVVANGAALSEIIYFRDQVIGGFIAPASLAANTKVAFKVSASADGTFVPLYDQYGALVEVTVSLSAAGAYPFPQELFSYPFAKVWTENAGVDVNQSAEKSFLLCMKG